jgi:hypothetical protein
VQQELLTFERGSTPAVADNDAAAIARFVADDRVIVDADGRVIDRSRFLSVVESGALTHESMGNHGEQGTVHGQGFTTRERATDVLARLNGSWLCVFSQLARVASA